MYSKKIFLPIRLLIIILGFVVAVNLPILLSFNPYQIKIQLQFSLFKEYVISNLTWFTHTDEYPWILKTFQGDGIEKYFYTMTILFIALLVVIILSVIIATCIMLLPYSIQKKSRSLVDFTTTLPDLLILFLLQYLVITLYKTYHIKLFQLYGGMYTNPYFVPIVILSFFPTILLIQLILKEYITEQNQDYVLLARAKGLRTGRIYFKHIFRNIIPMVVIHLKYIVWFMLSSIYIIETMLNIHGYSEALKYMYGTRVVLFVIGLFLYTLPLILVSAIGYFVSLKKRKENSSL